MQLLVEQSFLGSRPTGMLAEYRDERRAAMGKLQRAKPLLADLLQLRQGHAPPMKHAHGIGGELAIKLFNQSLTPDHGDNMIPGVLPGNQ